MLSYYSAINPLVELTGVSFWQFKRESGWQWLARKRMTTMRAALLTNGDKHEAQEA
jgi:hypothetical protein